METVTIQNVEGPNSNGWFNVELSDGRTATTKDKKVAETAFQSRNTSVLAEITEKVNGKFTNVYLNKIEKTNGNGATPEPTAEVVPLDSATPVPSYTDKQNLIAAQWAVGRAVELGIANREVDFSELETTARTLLALSRKLAAE